MHALFKQQDEIHFPLIKSDISGSFIQLQEATIFEWFCFVNNIFLKPLLFCTLLCKQVKQGFDQQALSAT